MKFINKLKALESIIRVKLVKKRMPLAVRWQLTNKCPNKCFYGKIRADDCTAITPKAMFKKVVILNIDGARKDIFDSLNLPAMNKLAQEGASHPRGLETIYRALTNPAFASILTGTAPRFHGIRSNNFGQSIKTEGLPDIVPAIVCGSMHVKHFCKESWETRVAGPL
jgi:Type I phosphodiesterase / nucleotide pyrophosphatase